MSESLIIIPLTGPLLVGTTWEWGLLGILTLQVYTFYTESLEEDSESRFLAAQSATIADIAALYKVATIWLSGGFVGDIIVAASMITVHQQHKGSVKLHIAGNDAFSKQTREVLQKLILRVIETGNITAIAALLVLVLFQHFKTSYTYRSVHLIYASAFLLCNLYSIVVLTNINGRKSMALVLTRGSTSLGYASGRHEEVRSHELAFRRPAETTIDDAIPDTTSVNTASEREHLALSLTSPKADWCTNDSDKSQADTNKTS
ncbi:hypothetical protein BT96DRAFT_935070 [Gymnopus androsaceus JB14]|uniref:DUF6534 domain-containing protein n=1 Tax=Gymnopus androsaceus JB14 TaxID=1447944 RepID=A0A6A4I7M2_9AGAR|nr:hypothetical protein BT96DRAFT_935070 [Gymnopus androsaceus JB14]